MRYISRIINVFIVVALILLLSTSLIVSAEQVKIENYDTVGTTVGASSFLNTHIGQTFFSPATHFINRLDLKLRLVGSANGTFNVNYYETNGGLPDYAAGVKSFGSIDASEIPTTSGGEWVTISIAGDPSTNRFSKNTLYAVTFSYPGGADAFNAIQVWTDPFDAQYSEGWYVSSQDSGTSWTATAHYDILFANYGGWLADSGTTLVVETREADIYETAGGNFSIRMPMAVTPDYVSQNMTAVLSPNINMSSPITLYWQTGYRESDFTWVTVYSDIALGSDSLGHMLPSTTYYYRAMASYNGTVHYGETRTVETPAAQTIPSKPTVVVSLIRDVSPRYDQYAYVYQLHGRYTGTSVNGTVTSSMINNAGFMISGNTTANGLMLPPFERIDYQDPGDGNLIGADGTFHAQIVFDSFEWFDGDKFFVKAWVETQDHGTVSSKMASYRGQTRSIAEISTASQIGTITDQIESSLARRGFLNNTGKYMIIVIGMLVAWVTTRRDKVWSKVFPMGILGFGIIIGWIPVWLVAILALRTGLTIFQFVRRRTEGGG